MHIICIEILACASRFLTRREAARNQLASELSAGHASAQRGLHE